MKGCFFSSPKTKHGHWGETFKSAILSFGELIGSRQFFCLKSLTWITWICTRWAPKSSYKWSYRAPINGRKEMANCSYFTLVIGVITPFITGSGGSPCGILLLSPFKFQVQKEGRYFFCPSIHPSIHPPRPGRPSCEFWKSSRLSSTFLRP